MCTETEQSVVRRMAKFASVTSPERMFQLVRDDLVAEHPECEGCDDASLRQEVYLLMERRQPKAA